MSASPSLPQLADDVRYEPQCSQPTPLNCLLHTDGTLIILKNTALIIAFPLLMVELSGEYEFTVKSRSRMVEIFRMKGSLCRYGN